jgi:hypothetical protein
MEVHEAFWFAPSQLAGRGWDWDPSEHSVFARRVLPARSGRSHSMDLQLVLAHNNGQRLLVFELRDFLQGSQDRLARWRAANKGDPTWLKEQVAQHQGAAVGFVERGGPRQLQARRLRGNLAQVLQHPNLPPCECNLATTLEVEPQAWTCTPGLVTVSGLEFAVI